MEIRVDTFCSFKYRNVIATNPPTCKLKVLNYRFKL